MFKLFRFIKKYWFTFSFLFVFLPIVTILGAYNSFSGIQTGAGLSNIRRIASNLATAINTSNCIANDRQGVAFLGGTVEGAVIDVVGTPLNAMPTDAETAELTAVTMILMPVEKDKPNGSQTIHIIVPPGETDEQVETLSISFDSLEHAIKAQQYVFITPPETADGIPNAYVDNALIDELEYNRR